MHALPLNRSNFLGTEDKQCMFRLSVEPGETSIPAGMAAYYNPTHFRVNTEHR